MSLETRDGRKIWPLAWRLGRRPRASPGSAL